MNYTDSANLMTGSVYAKTKSVGEGIVLRANRQKGLLTTAIRLTTLFGEGDVVLTKHFLELAKTGKIKYQVGGGKNFYDFIYAGNAVTIRITFILSDLVRFLRI
jgi:sterol-4alpha-carboxylate 3-dehydrogenase (decarboxylating)